MCTPHSTIGADGLNAGGTGLRPDEPTAGLDAEYHDDIVALLSRLRDIGKTIITVTHDLEMAYDQSDHLIVMDA